MDNPGEILRLCRLCLVKDQVNIPIFEEQGDIRQIFLKISSCLPVTVSRDDQLPKKICDGCSNKLDLLYEFWNTSANAEKTLLSWLGQAGVKDADETISAVAQQIKPAETQVKEEALEDGHAISQDNFGLQSFDEDTKDEAEPPPRKRARRTAAVKAQISIAPESDDDDDDMDNTEAMTKVEGESEESDGEDRDPSYGEVPGTSADDQAGPSGVGKDGVEAPSETKFFKLDPDIPFKIFIEDITKANLEIIDNYRKEQARFNAKQIKDKNRLEIQVNKKITRKVDKKNSKTSEKKGMFIERENTFVCTLCDRLYISKRLFDFHKYVHRLEWKKSQQKLDISRNMFICNFCEAECPTSDQMNSHIESHKESCKECGQTYANAFILGIHMAEHDPEEKMCCSFCNYRGTLYDNLKTHLLTKHFKLKIFRCDNCGKTYSSKVHLEEHRRYHHENMEPNVCIVCDRKFIFKSSLSKHQINVHRPLIDGDVPSNYCILCKRTLSTVEALTKHIQEKHIKEKPKNTERFVCDICGNDFSHRQSWLLHTKRHTELNSYKCKVCPKAFKVQASLTAHEKIHSDEKPFSCEVCGAGFKIKEGLRRHSLTHTDIKPFECPTCSKGFRRREHLKLHSKSCNKGHEYLLGL